MYFLEKQINANSLRAEYGTELINDAVAVIIDCMKATSRTISGESVDNSELQRVFSEVSEQDVRRSLNAVREKRPANFAGYFGSVLFNQIKSRLDKPQSQSAQSSYSFGSSPSQSYANNYASIDVDEVMDSIMEKYRNLGAE